MEQTPKNEFPAAVQPGESTLPELDVNAEDIARVDALSDREFNKIYRDRAPVEFVAEYFCRERQLLSTLTALTAARAQVERWKMRWEAALERLDETFIGTLESSKRNANLAAQVEEMKQQLSAAKAAHGETLLLLQKALFPYSAPAQETTAHE